MTTLNRKQLRHVANHGTNVARSRAVALQLIDCMDRLERAEQDVVQLRADFEQYVAITESLLDVEPTEPVVEESAQEPDARDWRPGYTIR